MASFSLLISSNPFTSEGHWQALAFAQAMLTEGEDPSASSPHHQLMRVFFYSDAVLVGNDRIKPSQGQSSPSDDWVSLAQAHQFPLQCCIANSIRRGILDTRESDRYELSGASLLPDFELVGLGEMIQALQDSDRVIQF